MHAINAVFVWSPKRHPFPKTRYSGTVAVLQVSGFRIERSHPYAMGACDPSWARLGAEYRHSLLQRFITTWLEEDSIDQRLVRRVVTSIEEYKDFPFRA